jgi:ComF family protein
MLGCLAPGCSVHAVGPAAVDSVSDMPRLLHLGSSLHSTFASRLTAGCDAILAIVLAPSCAACGELLDHPTRGPVCERCWQSIRPLSPPLCDACGEPLASPRLLATPLLCARCRRTVHHVVRARAVGAYDEALRAIVHALKYDGRRSIARRLGGLMQVSGADLLSGADLAVPVPLHRSRHRLRGFNQAEDLARHLGLPVVRALQRVRATLPQAELSEARRRHNVRNAFAPARRAATCRGATIVLVDDVSTTGATLEACARTLREAGAREVRAVTAARAVRLRR